MFKVTSSRLIESRSLIKRLSLAIPGIGALAIRQAAAGQSRPRELSSDPSSVNASVGISAARLPRFNRETLGIWFILAVTSVVFLRGLGNGFVLDDVAMFVKNPDLGHWSFLWKAFTREEFWYSDAGFLPHFRNYRPLLLVWCWVDYKLFGLNPAPWHASIVAVHLLAVWLVFKISRQLTGESTAALLAAAVFALTPVHAAAIVWMAGSCYVLGTALGLAAFYLLMPRADGTPRSLPAAMALYAGALLSHESAMAFPLLVACYAFLFDPRSVEATGTIEWNLTSLWMRTLRAVVWQAPFAAVLLLYLVTRRLVLGFYISNPYDYMNLLSNTQAVLTVPLVFVAYLVELVMPWRTLPNHHVLPVSSPLSPEFWGPLIAIVLLGVALVVVALRDPRRRLHLFCAAWMAVTLAPMMVLHSLPHILQDYYLYLPSVGFCVLVGDLLASLAQKNALARRLTFAGACAMLMVYGVALWRVEAFWHDDVAAGTAFVQGDPDSVGWRWNLAYFLEQHGDWAEAENQIRAALLLEPDQTGIFHPHSSALHHILGELLARRGDIDGAELEFQKSVNGPPDEDETHPTRLPPVYNHDGISQYDLGLKDAKAGRINQAIAEMTKGLEIMKRVPVPEYEPLSMRYIELVELYDSIGNQGQVEGVLKEVDSMPEGELAVGLAHAKIRLNHSDDEGAGRILRRLSDSYPDNYEVLVRLGDVEFKLKQYDQAMTSYQRAGIGWLGSAQLHSSIAKTLHAMGRDREALDQCRLVDAMGQRDWVATFSCAQVRNEIQNK